MDTETLIREISVKDVDVDRFVRLTIDDECIRDEIVHQLVTHPWIMVYYHCYYVVSKASQKRPELFYQYWPRIAPLLKHENSYHRDIGLTIIANLTQVDVKDLFSGIFHGYFEHINDEKFMTGQCCVQNSIKVIKNKPAFRDEIIAMLLDVDHRCSYTEKQKGVLKSDVLDVLDEAYEDASDREGVDAFIRAGVNSISPKTRRRAKELVKKYGL
jgi:hypothetical protein